MLRQSEHIYLYYSMKLRTIETAIKRRSESPRAKRQQQDRRKDSLLKKAYEYSIGCDAQVYLGIRIKRNGQVFVFNSENTQEWLPLDGQMVYNSHLGLKKTNGDQNKYYPIPIQLTLKDFQNSLREQKALVKPNRNQRADFQAVDSQRKD